jgi:hypothetical protein
MMIYEKKGIKSRKYFIAILKQFYIKPNQTHI